MMATAFMVTEGCYSDYHVVGVFTTREKAEYVVSLFPDRQRPDIKEVELDAVDGFPDGFPVGRRCYSVRFDKDGNSTAKQDEPHIVDESCWPYGDGINMITRCWATSEAHAIKIANERRAMAIAMGTWETDFRSGEGRKNA